MGEEPTTRGNSWNASRFVCPQSWFKIPLRWRGHGYSYIKEATSEFHGKWEDFLKGSLLTFTIQFLGRAQYRNMYIIYILIANDGCFKGFPAILLVLEDMKLVFCFLGGCFTFQFWKGIFVDDVSHFLWGCWNFVFFRSLLVAKLPVDDVDFLVATV